MTNDDEIAKALERWRRFHEGEPLHVIYRSVPRSVGSTISGLYDADCQVLATAYAARTPVVPGPVREAAERIDRFEEWFADPKGKDRADPYFATAFNRHTDIKTVNAYVLSLTPGGPTP